MSIICHFKLWDIATSHELQGHYYPKDLLGEALQNYEERQRKERIAKIKRMVI